MSRLLCLILIQVLLMTVTTQKCLAVSQEKPAIVLTAFGTSVAEARKVFDFIDQQARLRYPEYDLHWALTSQFIIDKLKKQGIVTYNVNEIISQLREQGQKQVVFQSLHVAPGQEYRSVLAADTSGLEVVYGTALLTSDADIDRVVVALSEHINPVQPTIVVAHGNDRYPQFNQRIEAFAQKIEAVYPQLVVASVEGSPGVAPLQKVKEKQPQQVNFVPLMIVAGDHIINDVLGDEPDSWKNIIAAPQTDLSPSLGWNKEILNIYFDHLDQALLELKNNEVD
jgi:sirohydrochlorin cobaltochelatase